MIKLKEAKCPSCGANLEVNDKLEKTICQYCGNTVMIEEAIQKYQIELSGKIELEGKVEVDGIKTNKARLEEAKKHFKVGEYNAAIKLLNELIDKEHFNIEAHAWLLKSQVALSGIRENDKGLTSAYEDDRTYWENVKFINSNYERLKKIDDKNEANEFLEEDFINKLNYCQKIFSSLKSDEEKCVSLTSKINSAIDRYGYDHKQEAIMILKDIFKFKGAIEYTYHKDNMYTENSRYNLSSIQKVTRNGNFVIRYRRGDYNDLNNGYYSEYCNTAGKTNSIEQLEERVNKFVETLDTNIKTKKRGKMLKKANWEKMSFVDKIYNVIEKILIVPYILIRISIPLVLIIVCILKLISTVKTSGFGSEDMKTGLIGSAIICIPCIIWIIKVLKDD